MADSTNDVPLVGSRQGGERVASSPHVAMQRSQALSLSSRRRKDMIFIQEKGCVEVQEARCWIRNWIVACEMKPLHHKPIISLNARAPSSRG